MKGIILAGGKATRLYPVTKTVCKQLLPVYDKPMIYYPLSVLMLAGIKEILIISTPKDLACFKELFGSGRHLGLKLSYAVQKKPQGIAQAFIIAEKFIGQDSVSLILGDNIFFGNNFTEFLKDAEEFKEGATIFGYWVKNPSRYGVIGFDKAQGVSSIEEKPVVPKSNWVVTGLYFYDNDVVKIAKSIKSSKRGELEITAVNNVYLKRKQLSVKLMGRGYAWLDTGTHDSLLDASTFIKTIEDRQGLKIGCIEEIAFRMGYISVKGLLKLAAVANSEYGAYLRKIIKDEK